MTRPTRAIIKLSALAANLELARQQAPAAKQMAVIKANGYGHGILNAARGLRQADGFAVACLEEALVLRDVITGEIKAVIFGLIIAAVGCFYGFQVRGGAEGVGRNTTATVVTSIFLVIVADGIFTLLFYVTG